MLLAGRSLGCCSSQLSAGRVGLAQRQLSSSSCSSQGSEGNLDFSYSILAVLAACACYCLNKTFLSIKKDLWGVMTHHHQPLHLVRDQNCWRRNFLSLKRTKNTEPSMPRLTCISLWLSLGEHADLAFSLPEATRFQFLQLCPVGWELCTSAPSSPSHPPKP